MLSEGKLPAGLHEFVFDLQLIGPLLNGVDCGDVLFDVLFGVLGDVLGELDVLKGGEAGEQSQVLKNEARVRRPPVCPILGGELLDIAVVDVDLSGIIAPKSGQQANQR